MVFKDVRMTFPTAPVGTPQKVGVLRKNEISERPRMGMGDTIQLSESGIRNLQTSRDFHNELELISNSDESTGDRLQDMAMAFERIHQRLDLSSGNRPPTSNASDRFVNGEAFTRGEVIFYNDSYWEVLQDFTHNGDQNWRPGLAHSLFAIHSTPPASQTHCPYLVRVFTQAVNSFLVAESKDDLGIRSETEFRFNGMYASGNLIVDNPQHTSELFLQIQQRTDTFVKEVLRDIGIHGYETAFNNAVSVIR